MKAVENLLESAVGAIGGSPREGQQEMAQAVASALDKGIHLLVQAGTGTGKSLAYLVPAAEYVTRTGGKVVVSTATLALQTQIIHRDLPRLFKAVKKDLDPLPQAALLKGRRNYVCKHKLSGGYPDEGEGMLFDLGADAEAGRKPTERSGLGEEIQRIRTWEKTTDTGDRDDLLPGVSDRAWSQVSVNAFDCLGSNCPLFTECFAEIARNKAAEADIVVTNHALLAIDAFGESNVLPEHDVIIIDEAHELKDRVTSALSGQINTSMLSAATSSVRKHTTVQDGVVSLLTTRRRHGARPRYRGLILHMSEALGLAGADPRLRRRSSTTSAANRKPMPVARWQAAARDFELAERFCDPGKNDVIWLSRSTFREKETTNLVVAPLSVAGTMRNGIFEESTVVATSATLSLGGNFDAVAASLGLFGPDAPKWDSLDVGSPFDYGKQGILYVASHLPKPGRSGLSDEALIELEELVEASNGGALGLFSSGRARMRRPNICGRSSISRSCSKAMTDCPPSSPSSLPTTRPACSGPCPCGRASTCRDARTAWSSSTGCPSRAPTIRSCRRGHAMPTSGESTDSWLCRPRMPHCDWLRGPDASSGRPRTGEWWPCSTRGCARPGTPDSSSTRCRGCGPRRTPASSARASLGWPKPTRDDTKVRDRIGRGLLCSGSGAPAKDQRRGTTATTRPMI